MRAARDGSFAVLVERATALLDSPPLLVASDFDGTLAFVQPDPWAARIHGPSQRALRRLAIVPGVHVVLFSGRTAGDLASRTRIGGVTYLGDHGVERADVARGFRPRRMRVATVPAPERERALAQHIAEAVPRDVPERWLVVERKSAAVAFHFRTAPDIDEAGARIRAAIDRHDPEGVLERHLGRRAIELRPPSASTKALAMTRIVDELRPGAVLILGDGIDDAAAFRALGTAGVGSRVALLRLAVAGQPDVTRHVAPHADAVLDSPRDVGRLLGALADRARVSPKVVERGPAERLARLDAPARVDRRHR